MPNSNNRDGENSKQNPHYKPVMWAILIAIIGVAILAVVGKFFVNEHSEKIRFVTVNALSLFVLLAIGVQAYIYRRQWEVMERQLGQTDQIINKMQGQWDAMQEQSGLMRDALVETRKGVEIAERSLILGTRAYVGINSIRVDLIKTKRVHVKLGNTGKLPAEDVKIFVEMLAMIYPKWEVPNEVRSFTRRTFSFDYGRTKLFPVAFTIDFGISLDHYLRDRELTLISKQEGVLIIRGYAEYGDGFEAGQQSHFALRYVANDDMWTPYPIDKVDNPLDQWIADQTKERDSETHCEDPL